MKNYLKNLYISAILISNLPSLSGQITPYTNPLSYRYALVRDLADSFEDSLKLNQPIIPIDIDLAKKQHENNISLLEQLIPEVVRLEADPNHPDCNFIEDTAIILDDIAVISRIGALERRGEEIPVANALKKTWIKKHHPSSISWHNGWRRYSLYRKAPICRPFKTN